MKVVQIGSNRGDDELSKYLKKNYNKLDFALFVEANPLHIEELKKCYEEYENVFIENIAIKPSSHEQDTLKLYYYEDDAPLYEVTSCVKSHIEKHYRHLNYSEDKLHHFEVSALTIDDLFLKYNIKELDWLLLDVEGIDAELLVNTDWNKYDIKKIEYEKLHLGDYKQSVEEIFKKLGYVQSIALHHYDDVWIKSNGENKMKITLYAICKNEEKNVERFIENSKKFSHTVVVDTGSTDKTVELLRDAGITVYEHPQTREEFDFSVARNQALSYVETDWAFSLDFNEDIGDFFVDGLDVISGELSSFKHLRYDKMEDDDPILSSTSHIRFHRTKNYIWQNAVHETPMFVSTDDFKEEIFVDTTIKITKNVQISVDKQLFYLSICEREHQNNPENTYYLWFIFKHYFEVKNFQKVIEFGEKYLDVSKSYFDQLRIDVFVMCSIAYVQLQNILKASNYAFHALSESMNNGNESMGKAFSHLLEIGKLVKNPNIIVFASGFSQDTKKLPLRTNAIDNLFFSNLDDIPSDSWSGHRNFAEWLVNYINPKVIVDLGVDYGFSTFSFATPRIGHVYGIDNFVGDEFVGYDQNRMKFNFVMMKREKMHLQDNLTFIEGDFSEVAKTWDKKIDILHIDGSHIYEEVKKDFETWIDFLNDDGIVLLHDTNIEMANGHEYGVKKFFEEIEFPKFNFTHSFGLGVVCKNQNLLKKIEDQFLL